MTRGSLIGVCCLGIPLLFLAPDRTALAVEGTAGETADSDTDLRIPYERYQLANGMEVILHRDASAPLV